jgi:hypothetical protein
MIRSVCTPSIHKRCAAAAAAGLADPLMICELSDRRGFLGPVQTASAMQWGSRAAGGGGGGGVLAIASSQQHDIHKRCAAAAAAAGSMMFGT